MGHIKTSVHPPDRNFTARLFKSLAHPARIAIVQYLVCHKLGNGLELREQTQLSQQSFAQHIRMMTRSELIKTKYVGQRLNYYLNQDQLTFVNTQLGIWNRKFKGGPPLSDNSLQKEENM